jgi:membrane protein
MQKKIWKIFKNSFMRFNQEGLSIRAAGLAYVTLLAIVPLITVSLSILSAFPGFQAFELKMQELIVNNFVGSSAQVAQAHLQEFIRLTSQLSYAGILSLLVTAVLMIFSMEQAFNHIWNVTKHRNIIQAFLLYWAVLTIVPIILAIGFMFSSYLTSIPEIIISATASKTEDIISFFLPYILTTTAFTLLYVGLPNCKVRIRHAIIGGLFAALLFKLVKYGFTYFIAHFANYTLLYGALAAIPVFLLWLYLSWVVILIGALITYELEIVNHHYAPPKSHVQHHQFPAS